MLRVPAAAVSVRSAANFAAHAYRRASKRFACTTCCHSAWLNSLRTSSAADNRAARSATRSLTFLLAVALRTYLRVRHAVAPRSRPWSAAACKNEVPAALCR